MKLEVLQENLSSALTTATRIISSKPQLPILTNVFLKASKEGSLLIASNVDSTIIVPFGSKIIDEGEICVPGRTFQELISSLPSDKIILEAKETSLIVKELKFQGKITCMPGSDFPTPPKEPNATVWKMSKNTFQTALSETLFSAAVDETRAVLNGVLFKFDGSAPMLVATDGFRLSKYTLESDSKIPKDLTQLVLPSKALQEVSRLLSDSSVGDFEIHFGETNTVSFLIGEIEFYSQTIAGNFPSFEKIIPSTFDIKIKLNAEELLKSIKSAAIFARENANIINFNIHDNTMTVRAQGGEVGENETELDIEVEKPPVGSFSVSFNFRYVLDFLGSLNGAKDITLELGTPTSAALFRPIKVDNYLHIIMPVRVQG